jgi:hypothetical protein
MTGEEFVSNEWVLKMIGDLKANNIKIEGEFIDDDIRQLNYLVKYFKMMIWVSLPSLALINYKNK